MEELTLHRVERLMRQYTVAATNASGAAVTLSGVDVALLPLHGTPTSTTTWQTGTFASGVLTVLYAGPDADATGALPVPAPGGDLWLRITDGSEIDVQFVERVRVR